MSTVIFATQPGRLVAVPANEPRALALDLGGFQSTGVLVGLDIEQGVAAQFQPSLDGVTYVTPFGDKMGTLRASLILNSMLVCNGASERGLDQFVSAYISRRLTPSNPEPMTMVVGSQTYVGFAIGFNTNSSSEQGHMIRGQLMCAAWLGTEA